MKQSYIYTIIFICLGVVVKAQNNNSAYSSIGLGNIEQSTLDRTSGMANAGIATTSNRFMLHANPASYSFLDDRLFHFESAIRFRNVNYVSERAVTTTSQNQSNDMQFKKIAAAIKVKPKIGISVGLLPFSNSNYSYFGQKSIIGSSNTADVYNEGTGSINQFYGAVAYKLTKRFSVGVQMSYLFGQMQRKETIFTGVGDSVLVTNDNTSYTNPVFKGGFIYNIVSKPKLKINLAAAGSVQTKLRANHDINVTYGRASIFSEELYKSTFFTLPKNFTAGFNTQFNDAYSIAFDYKYQNWAASNVSGISYQLVDAERLALGFEYSKKLEFADPYTNQKVKFEKYFFQAGVFYHNSYTRVYGEQLKDYGLTLGLGINSVRNPLGFIFNFEFGRRGTIEKGLIRENYSQIGFTLCYRDFWYTTKKRYN